MPVIAMTQEMGSLAKDVAERSAEALGLRVMRHEVVEHVAGRMQVPKSLIRRLREGKAGAGRALRGRPRPASRSTPPRRCSTRAARGNVVLRGWGATCLLRPVPHVVCVRVTRPFAQRVQWLMERLGTDDVELAEAEIRRSDRGPCGAHARAVRRHLGRSRCSTTSCSTPSACRSTAAWSRSPRWPRRPEFAETAESRGACCRTWRSRRACAPRCAPTRRPASVDVTIDIARRPRDAARHRGRCRRRSRAAERVAAARAGRGRGRQPAARDGRARACSRRPRPEGRCARALRSCRAASAGSASRPTG